MTHYKKLMAVSALALLTLTGILATRPAGLEGPFRNLQVLSKNMDGEKMELVMGFFNSELGVTCGYCHPWRKQQGDIAIMDFASDEKPEKKIAREMLRMSIKLNRKYFNSPIDGKLAIRPLIWCKTCHKGLIRPSMVAKLRGQE